MGGDIGEVLGRLTRRDRAANGSEKVGGCWGRRRRGEWRGTVALHVCLTGRWWERRQGVMLWFKWCGRTRRTVLLCATRQCVCVGGGVCACVCCVCARANKPHLSANLVCD